MVFKFIEAEWGEDGLRDFIFAFRTSMGGIERPIRRLFNMDPEEFDSKFRAWLRKYYRTYLERGNPSEFGRPFRIEGQFGSFQSSPALSPAGDLVAAFSTYKDDVDVVTFGVPDRRLFKNLTKGYTNKFQYVIAQGLTVGPDRGRDLAFSPDGNFVAVFARTERSRSLVLLDAIKGGIEKMYEIPQPVDQAMQPAYSPDGNTVAFRGVVGGKGDIFLLKLADGSVTNLTDDEAFDSSPTFSPDGKKIVYSSQSNIYSKLVEVDVADPSKRRQLTFSSGDDEGAAFSADGKRLFFASDRLDGIFDIYGLDLETRELTRLTYVIGAALNPVPANTLDGERVGFQAFGQGRVDLYMADPNRAVSVGVEEPPKSTVDLEPFIPSVSISVDTEKSTPLRRRKLFVENARAMVGVDQDGRFLSQTYISFADQYGDRRLSFLIDSISSYTNAIASYMNLEPRLQWGVQVFDYRSYYLYGYDPGRNRFNEREEIFNLTGASFLAQYPFSTSYRLEGQLGYTRRSAFLPGPDPGGSGQIVLLQREEDSPFVTFGVAGDTTVWQRYGPHSGSRWEVKATYSHDLDGGGALSKHIIAEGRKYIPLSRRNELAMRIFGAWADGNRPYVWAFGGYDTVRGFRYRSIPGNRAVFANIEWRLPLIENLRFSFLPIGDVRARVFLDVGAGWYEINGQEYNYLGDPGFKFMEDGRLKDGVSSYGFGFSMTILGMPVNWDFAQRWDFKDGLGDKEMDFFIGLRF
jgi:hypothetical protein